MKNQIEPKEFRDDYKLGKEDIKEKIIDVKKKFDLKNSPVGAVMRPDAKKLESWKDTPEAQETEEMRKTFKKIFTFN